MRRIFPVLAFGAMLPLAACFDVDLSLGFPDADTAEATMVMTSGPEFYAMMTSNGDPFCDGGKETTLDDGRHRCSQTFSGPVDEVMNDPDMGKGMTIEPRGGGLLYVAFDLGDIGQEVTPPEQMNDGSDEMQQTLAAAFTGHAITLNVSGSRIIETNGTISDDGTKASFTIPLDQLVSRQTELPSAFETVLKPGT